MNEKFIWKEGELEKISQDKLEKLGVISYNSSSSKHFCRLCNRNEFCNQQCDKYRSIANKIADAIFKKYFNEDSSDINLLRGIISDFDSEVQKNLDGDAMDKGLSVCLKIHFMDLIQFETLIDVPTDLLDNFLAEAN